MTRADSTSPAETLSSRSRDLFPRTTCPMSPAELPEGTTAAAETAEEEITAAAEAATAERDINL